MRTPVPQTAAVRHGGDATVAQQEEMQTSWIDYKVQKMN